MLHDGSEHLLRMHKYPMLAVQMFYLYEHRPGAMAWWGLINIHDYVLCAQDWNLTRGVLGILQPIE